MAPKPPRASWRAASLLVLSAFTGLLLTSSAFASDTGERSAPAGRPTSEPMVVPAFVVGPTLSPPLIGPAMAEQAVGPAPVVSAPLRAAAGEAPSVPVTPRPAPHPRGLLPLFAGYAALQALDAQSTLSAINHGATEQNPLVAPMVSRPALFIAFKSAVTASTIVAADRLSRRHRLAAYGLRLGLNSAYAMVVVHNYRVARQGQ